MKNLRISKKFLAIVTACLSLSVFSCKDELSNLDSPPSGGGLNKNVSVEEQDKARIEVAKILAKSLAENVELRKYMKTEAMKQFDNDFDILWVKSKNDLVDGQKTFNQFLKEVSPKIDDVSTKLPLLNFLFPWIKDHSIVDWNTDSEIPLVAVIGSKELKKNNKTILAYDAEGNEYVLDAIKHPDRIVVIVEDSERIQVLENNEKARASVEKEWKPLIQNNEYQYFYRGEGYVNQQPKLTSTLAKISSERIAAPQELVIGEWINKIPESGNFNILEYNANATWGPFNSIFNKVPEIIDNWRTDIPNREALYFKNNRDFNYQIRDKVTYFRLLNQGQAETASDGWTEGNLEIEMTRMLGGKTANEFSSFRQTKTIGANYSYNGSGPHFVWTGNQWSSLLNFQDILRNGQVWGQENTYFGSNESLPQSFKGNWVSFTESGFQWSSFRYGDSVKYIFEEHDNGEVTENTIVLTTNFSASVGRTGFDKDPGFFNISGGFSTTSTQKITSTNNSDYLGDAVIYYNDKIGFIRPSGPYATNAVQFISQTK